MVDRVKFPEWLINLNTFPDYCFLTWLGQLEVLELGRLRTATCGNRMQVHRIFVLCIYLYLFNLPVFREQCHVVTVL